MKLFEYVNARGRGVYSEWYAERPRPSQAALDAKLSALRRGGEVAANLSEALPPNLLRGPVKGYPKIYKLTVNGQEALRPLCCRGPLDMNSEVTILHPVVEKDRKLPPDSFDVAERRRREIVLSPSARRRELKEDNDK